mgnify:CR=1 FL=1
MMLCYIFKTIYPVNLVFFSIFTHLLPALDKEMRTWDCYMHLDSTVKNMLTSLRAVAELQNPSLRARHWDQLMEICSSVETPSNKVTKRYCAEIVSQKRRY